jgi:protein-tyrosine-phosphatase
MIDQGAPFSVLFLCTGNSARSIVSEALLNRRGEGRFRAYSAGSRPAGRVNPHALELLRRLGHETASLRSKSWDEFALPDSPRMDFVFTVCDNAAGEGCPIWPGQPITAHWGVPDPAAVEGSTEDIRKAFEATYVRLGRRIDLFASLPLHSLSELAIRRKVDEIGRL